MKVLAGDIGGTKTLLQIVDVSGSRRDVILEKRFESREYSSFDLLLENFIASLPGMLNQIKGACLAIAGPVQDVIGGQRVATTNLPWHLDTAQLCSKFKISRLRLVNDFFAIGTGIAALADSDLRSIQNGLPQPHAPRLVLGAGTGLGVAQLIWRDAGYRVLPSEGGHVGFTPETDDQVDYLRYMRRRYGRVSWERVVSGPGLLSIYTFLYEASHGADKIQLSQVMNSTDPAAAINEHATCGDDAVAEQALQWFVELYGAVAGDLALVNLPYGGVYLAGGIAPKILDQRWVPLFIQAFTNKGRMSSLAQSFPVHVVTHPSAGLLGAALIASHL